MKGKEQLAEHNDKARGEYRPQCLRYSRFNQSLIKLPSRFQEVLVLKYVAGLHVEDIAVVIKSTASEASKLLQEAHEAMVKEVALV